jgi:hypothetical protein
MAEQMWLSFRQSRLRFADAIMSILVHEVRLKRTDNLQWQTQAIFSYFFNNKCQSKFYSKRGEYSLNVATFQQLMEILLYTIRASLICRAKQEL